MAQRELVVRILGDDKDLQRAFKRSSASAAVYEGRIDKLSRGALAGSGAFGGFGRSIAFASTAFLGGAGFVAAARASVEAASNLNEQTSKGRAIFKGSSREIERWARTTSTSFGISEDAALQATGTFGGLFNTVGVLPRRSAELSKSLVELAADLASFNNAVPTEALDALRSGVSGESEPLRRFQIFLSEARVQQEAFTQTGKRSAKELTNQEKVLARLAIIMRDSSAAQGDFARTSEGFANQTRILSAELRNLSAQIGKVALPALTDLVAEMNRGIGIAQDFGDAIGKIPGSERLTKSFGANFAGNFKRNFLPGIALAGELADKVDFLKGRIAALKGEAAAPFNFSALDQLTAGLTRMTDALAARDRIEAQLEADRIRPARGPNITVEQRNQFFDAKIAREINRVQDASLREQVAQLEGIADRIRDKIKVTKDITRLQTLEDDLLDVNRQKRAVQEQIASNAEAARQLALDQERDRIEKARTARLEAIAKELDRRNRRQFFALGLSLTGGERTPNIAGLRRQLGNFEDAVKGTFLDTEKTRSVLGTIRKLLAGGFGKMSEQVRATVRDMLRDLNQQLDNQRNRRTRGRGLNVASVLAGLGLDRDTTKELRARLSHVSAGGQVLASRGGVAPLAITAAGRQGLVFTGPITVISNDPADMARKLQKSGRRIATQTTGPHAGNSSGFTG